MIRALPALLATLALAACNPTPAATPAPGGAAAPVAAATFPPAATPSGPAIANTGSFTPAAGQAPKFRRTEVTSQGPQVQLVTFAVDKVTDGIASFKVTAQATPGGPSADRASGTFEIATGNHYWGLVDTNLKSADVWATGKAETTEDVAVAAGLFTCTRTRYQKQVTPAAFVDITLWTNGTVGLVKAQVANKLTVGSLSQTSDVKYELEAK